MKILDSFTATIYVGFLDTDRNILQNIEKAEKICEEYCNRIGLCVTITPTTFIYSFGREPGCSIGLINYPRFPSTPEEITRKALEIAKILLIEFDQYKVSVVCSDKTYMLERKDYE